MPTNQPVPAPDDLERQLALVDAATALPFPDTVEGQGVWHSGPDFHVLTLHASQDFWDDRATEVVEAAYQEVEDVLAPLAAVLTRRWGPPRTIDLWFHLEATDRGHPAREPILYLCHLALDLQVWAVPDTDRWLGLAVGQADTEFPVELLAAVGTTAALAPPAPDGP